MSNAGENRSREQMAGFALQSRGYVVAYQGRITLRRTRVKETVANGVRPTEEKEVSWPAVRLGEEKNEWRW